MDINDIHENLKFTIERENQQNQLPFLDTLITRKSNRFISTLYTKPTDTGLTMNYHALAPLKYKKVVVFGLVHRIYRACSTWESFHDSIVKVKNLLHNNQYPPVFHENLIEEILTKILKKRTPDETIDENKDENENKEQKLFFVEYRGKISEKFETSLKRCEAPVDFYIEKIKKYFTSFKS